eukprot:g2968.t1
MCPNANYVVQKVVSHLSVAASSFVAWELQGNAVRAAKHRFACRIFCRLLEFCGTGPTSQLVDEFLDAAEENLCTHSFAHHVVQSILEHGEERHKRLIAKMLMADLWKHATHKNSSYLIEKALCYCDDEDQNSLIANLGYPQALLDLAMTQYGSFVARALLQDSRVNADLATRHIRRHQGDLESTKHGHRFLIDIGLLSASLPTAGLSISTTSSASSCKRKEPQGEEETEAVQKRRRKRRRKRKPRPLRKKPLPPAEATLEEVPLDGGGISGPLVLRIGWSCVLHDVHRRSFVSIRKKAFNSDVLARWRQRLMAKLVWCKPERPPKEGKSQEVLEDPLLPRSAAWLTLPSCRCEYEYAGLRFPPVNMPAWFLEITDEVSRACGLKERPNSCNANLYQTGADNVSWHCDDEPLFDATGRDALIDGDLCTMEGLCQKHYRHRVPPEEDVVEPRINLTWRWIVQHDDVCTGG